MRRQATNLDMENDYRSPDKNSSFTPLRASSRTSAASSVSAPLLLLLEHFVAFWPGALLRSLRAAAVSNVAAPAPSHSQPANLAFAEAMKTSCSERANASASNQVAVVAFVAVMS
jgi:hypothetical protein